MDDFGRDRSITMKERPSAAGMRHQTEVLRIQLVSGRVRTGDDERFIVREVAFAGVDYFQPFLGLGDQPIHPLALPRKEQGPELFTVARTMGLEAVFGIV